MIVSHPDAQTLAITAKLKLLMRANRASTTVARLLRNVLQWISYRSQQWNPHSFAPDDYVDRLQRCKAELDAMEAEFDQLKTQPLGEEMVDARLMHYCRRLTFELVRSLIRVLF